jgi:plastocyanin
MRAALALSLSAVFVASLACGAGGAPAVVPKVERDTAKAERRREAAPPPVTEGDVTIKVSADGRFEPAAVSVRPGAKVTWVLAEPLRDSIAPLRADAEPSCSAIAPWRPDDLTGPMPRNPGGLFVLNADGPGLVAKGSGFEEAGPDGAVMDASWASPSNTGAFLRLRWDWLQPDGEGKYDWTILDREVEKAVANGKMYSIAVKAGHHGTPEWIFKAGVDKLIFREFGSGEGADDCKCGAFMQLGNPTQDRYQELYFDMLKALSEHLKSNAAWYRNLAYIKSSGANLYSAENRLPKRCSCADGCTGEDRTCKVPQEWRDAPNLTSDGRICNTKVWADAGYTDDGLYEFYERQHENLAKWFPEKDMAYLLIHDGFPRVSGPDDYLGCGQKKKVDGLPDPTEQTQTIMRQGWRAHGERFTLMHAGLREDRKVNNLLQKERQSTQNVGLQTTNDVDNANRVQAVMEHALEHEGVTFVEVYEVGAMDVDRQKGMPDYNARLHQRRRQAVSGDGPLRDPFPTEHRHTFTEAGTFRYVDPYRCKTADDVGTVYVVPR